MKEFVYGTKEQFLKLDSELTSGKKYRFANRVLPDSCIPQNASLWFGKDNGIYRVCISKGITSNVDNSEFLTFLNLGEIKFSSFDELMSFFHSLKPLFVSSDTNTSFVTTKDARINESISDSNVVDRVKLKEIQNIDTPKKIVKVNDIAEPLKKEVFGQDCVIDSLARMIVLSQMRKASKLLSVALFGPTGTGKSLTAKTLAPVLSDVYGIQFGFLEIAGSEFEGSHSISRFLGAPPGYVGHGNPTLLDPVRENPYHVIVINEIEKADERILIGLMEAIDTGKLGMADNSRPIDLSRCIVFFTSNLPIDMYKYETCNDFEKSEMCRDVLTRFCSRPEISGKIGNFLAYNPLPEDAKIDVVIKFVRETLSNYDIDLIHIDEYLMADFLSYDTKYGARGIRVLVENALGNNLSRVDNLEDFVNKKVSIGGSIDNIEFVVS